MPKKFDLVTRLNLEEDGDHYNSLIKAEIMNIESKAKKLLEEGKSEAIARINLQNDVDDLVYRVKEGNQNNVLQIDTEVEEIRKKYLENRDRNPSAELVQMQRAKLKYDSLSQKELEDEAMGYTRKSELSWIEAQTLSGKITDPLIRDNFKKTVHDSRLDQPWIDTQEKHDLLNDRQRFTEAGSGLISNNMHMDVESLIDFSGEMEAYST